MPSALAFLEGSPVQPWRERAFRVSYAIFGVALFGATWRLWTPQTVFPQVPLFAIAGEVPAALQWSFAALVLLSLITIAIGKAGRAPLVVLAASFALLAFIDQHRLQPWAFQWAIFAIALAALPAPRAFVLLRWLTVSIYVWSAIAKIDATFSNTLGQQFLASLVGVVGMDTATWSPSARLAGAWMFPVSELVIGLCFALPLERFKRLRRTVIGLAVAMHLALILLLSSWALDHQPAVMLWNDWFIVQAVLLFGFPSTEQVASTSPTQPTHWFGELAEVCVELLVVLVIALPALNLFDRYDHWLAWGLYAPRNSRVTLYLQRDESLTIDTVHREYLDMRGEGEWVALDLGKWSIDALAVPIYPQDRFQLGVVEAAIVDVTGQRPMPLRFRIIIESCADRWTGRREQRTITSLRQLHDAQAKFFFNARPRPPR